MNVTLYTIHCPQCTVLQKKLDSSNIDYNIVDDVEKMKELGFKSAPILVVDDKSYTFSEAVKWIKEQENNGN